MENFNRNLTDMEVLFIIKLFKIELFKNELNYGFRKEFMYGNCIDRFEDIKSEGI